MRDCRREKCCRNDSDFDCVSDSRAMDSNYKEYGVSLGLSRTYLEQNIPKPVLPLRGTNTFQFVTK